jgi:hypothetical protein
VGEWQQIARLFATFPDTGAALKMDSEGAGDMRIKMDEQQYTEAIKALGLGREKLMRVTFEIEG